MKTTKVEQQLKSTNFVPNFGNVSEPLTEAQRDMRVLDAIKHFEAIFPVKHVIVSGSFALKLMGFSVILINKSFENVIPILERLQATDNSAHLSSDYNNSQHNFRLLFNGIVYDIICLFANETFLELTNGLKISTVRDIIAAKLSFKQVKDYLQLRMLAEQILPKSFFDDVMQLEKSKLYQKTELVHYNTIVSPNEPTQLTLNL